MRTFLLVALVVSQQFIHTTESNRYEAEIQIGQTVYIADDICKKALVGETYPARLDGHHLELKVGEKVCHYRVVGQRVTP